MDIGIGMKNIKYILLLFLTAFCEFLEAQTQRRQFSQPGFSIQFNDAVATPDSGFLFVGRIDYSDTHSEHYGFKSETYPDYIQKGFFGGPSTIVHKINAQGDSLWTRLYPYSVQGTAICATNDGGFAICGFKPTERERKYKNDRTQAVTVLKIDSIGDPKWFTLVPSDYNSTSSDILELGNGELLILSEKEYPSISDYKLNPCSLRLLRLSHKGEVLADKELHGKMDDSEQPYPYVPSQLLLNKEKLYVLGSNSEINAVYVAKIDTAGNVLKAEEFKWEKSKYSKEWNWGFSIAAVDSGLVFSASAYYAEEKGHHIVKVDENLQKKWEAKQLCDWIDESKMAVNVEGDCYFASNTDKNHAIVAKYDKMGKLLWERTIEDSKLFRVSAVLIGKNGQAFIAGSAHTHGVTDWIAVYYIFDAAGNLKN